MTELESCRASFLESMRARYAPGTIQGHGWTLDVFLRFLVSRGVDDPREVSRETVREYQAWMAGRKLAVRTVYERLVTVRRFFAHLETESAILINPCEGMALPKLDHRLPRRVLTLKEARDVLNAPDTQRKVGIRDKAMLELFYSTGIRVGEMSRLTIHDVDTRHGLVRVNQGKGSRDRVVPMGRRASDYVREYIREVRFLWSREQPEERGLWLGLKTPHRPLAACSIKEMVTRHGKTAGLAKPLSPHAWRHTCATHMVAAGANIAHVQKLLGHRSLQSTQIYTRVALPEVRQTFARSHPRAKMARA